MEKFPENRLGAENMGAKPPRVKQAQINGDIGYLKAAGRRGGLAAAAKRRAGKFDGDGAFDQLRDEQRQTDEIHRLQQAGEDILPINPDQ